MSVLTPMDLANQQMLRARLEAIPGVELALCDEPHGAACIICEAQSATVPIADAARKVLAELGFEALELHTVVQADAIARHRVRFVKSERIAEADNRTRIRITLEWHGNPCVGEAVGEAGDLIELKTAATAALNALERLIDDSLGVRVVGVKAVRAFDSELMVVSLHRAGGTPPRLVGTVASQEDGRAAAAKAVLNGLNRLLGNYLNVR